MNTTFQTLGVSPILCELLKKQGIAVPTQVQEKALPALFQGRDILGQAQTGTGKTPTSGTSINPRSDTRIGQTNHRRRHRLGRRLAH